jgi:hypothetical protein
VFGVCLKEQKSTFSLEYETFFEEKVKFGVGGADQLKKTASLSSGFECTVQISTFAPLAPLSPIQRGEASTPDAESHDHGSTSPDSSIGGVGAALGIMLPPEALLPAIGASAIIEGNTTSTQAPKQQAVGLPGRAEEAGAEAIDGLGAKQELTQEERGEVDQLKVRDREVRQHEQAHMAAAGPYASGGPSFEYTRGPDGKRYAVGGEVQIDTSRESEPEATIRKAQQIYRAALAPADPSSQDRSVASSAKKMEMAARQELAKENSEQPEETGAAGGEAASAAHTQASAPFEPSPLPGSGAAATSESVGLGGGTSEPTVGALIGGSSSGGSAEKSDNSTVANLLDLLA